LCWVALVSDRADQCEFLKQGSLTMGCGRLRPVRRIGRSILSSLTALSLLLCILTIGLWSTSLFTEFAFWRAPERGHWRVGFAMESDYLIVQWGEFWGDDNPLFARVDLNGAHVLIPNKAPGWKGIRIVSEEVTEAPRNNRGWKDLHVFQTTQVAVAYWLIVIVTMILPAIWVVRHRRGPKSTPGVCSGCGYDLRATHDRCPECGTLVACASASASS